MAVTMQTRLNLIHASKAASPATIVADARRIMEADAQGILFIADALGVAA